MPEETYFSVSQVALMFKVHPLTVRRYIKEGRLKAVRIAGTIRIEQAAINTFLRDIYPQSYGARKTLKTAKESIKHFTLDDAFFRLKGRSVSLKT